MSELKKAQHAYDLLPRTEQHEVLKHVLNTTTVVELSVAIDETYEEEEIAALVKSLDDDAA